MTTMSSRPEHSSQLGQSSPAERPSPARQLPGLRPGRRGKRRRRRLHLGANITALLFSIIWAFPVYWMINTAFKSRPEVMTTTPVFLSKHPTLSNFTSAFTQSDFLINLRNSAIVVVSAVVLSIVLGALAAAALSRFHFRGRRTIMVLILAVQMLPGTALLIPTFLVFNELNLLGTYFGLILAYVATVLPFSIWVMRGFFVAIPFELEEAAMIDGAGSWRILRSILFPLVMPGVIATSSTRRPNTRRAQAGRAHRGTAPLIREAASGRPRVKRRLPPTRSARAKYPAGYRGPSWWTGWPWPRTCPWRRTV